MKCELCGKECKGHSLGNHIVNSVDQLHKISLKDYYDKYLKKQNEGICPTCGKETTYVSLTGGYHKHCRIECVSKNPETIKKIQNTIMNNYGVDNASKSMIVQNQKTKTLLMRTSEERQKINKKRADTCLKRYNKINVSQMDSIKQLKKDTCFLNWGCEIPANNSLIMEKMLTGQELSWFVKYGVKNISSLPYFKQIHRENLLKRIEEYGNSRVVGNYEKPCFDELEYITGCIIERNPFTIGYVPDGHISNLRLLIEFDERNHFIDDYKTYTQKDIDRELELVSLGYIMYRIKLKEWLSNKEQVISNFKLLIDSLSNPKEQTI